MKSPFDFGDKFGWKDAAIIAFFVALFIYQLPHIFAENHWWTLRAKLLGTFLADLLISAWWTGVILLFCKIR